MADRPTPEQEAAMTAAITKQIADTQAMIARGENPFAPKPEPEKKDAPAPERLPLIKVTTIGPNEADPADTAKVAQDVLERGGGTIDAQSAAKIISGEIKVTAEQAAKARQMKAAAMKDKDFVAKFLAGDVEAVAWMQTVDAVIAFSPIEA